MWNPFKKKTVEEKKIIQTEKTVKEFLQDDRTKKITTDSAKYIQTKLKNWFTIDQLMDSTTYNKLESALDVMNLLCLAGLCYREEKQQVIKYKITLDSEARLLLLHEERKEAVEKVEYIDRMIEDVKKKASNKR